MRNKIAAISTVFLAVFAISTMWLSKKQTSAPTGIKMVAVDILFESDGKPAFDAPVAGSYNLPVIKPAGDGVLLDIKGKTTRLSQVEPGKVRIISFIYTTCSQEKGCPYAMSNLFDIFHASEKLPGLAANVSLVTISFDPLHDTPQAMASYGSAALADPDAAKKLSWHFLTAPSQKQLKPLLKAFGQSIDRSQSGDTIDHLLRLYLVDRKGRIRNIYGLGLMDPRLLYSDIYTLLLEDGTIKISAS